MQLYEVEAWEEEDAARARGDGCPRCGSPSYVVHGEGGYKCIACEHRFAEPTRKGGA